jgi:hypothetical protein
MMPCVTVCCRPSGLPIASTGSPTRRRSERPFGCGGAPLLDDGAAAPDGATLDTSLGDGPQLGKRYADDDLGLELLCTKPGAGAVTANGAVLPLKGAKPLPSSD